jgi:hypothetical protein
MSSIFVSNQETGTVLIIHPEELEVFKEMVNRAMNTWDKAPPELKSFADRLLVGHELQDYHNISSPVPRPDQ